MMMDIGEDCISEKATYSRINKTRKEVETENAAIWKILITVVRAVAYLDFAEREQKPE
jgi:hypothetical protein